MQMIINWKITPNVARLARFLMLGLIIPLIFGLVSLSLKKDINWDLKNYHYYNAYAFLEDRLNYDVAPAQIQTYLNPLLDLPFFLLSKHLSAPALGLLYGFFHGLNLSLIFLIFERVNKSQSAVKNYLVGIFLIIVTCTGPGFLSELGGTMNDNVIGVLVLSALLFSIISSNNLLNGLTKKGYIQVSIAGLLMGMAVGLKLTAGIFALSSAILLPMMHPSPGHKLRTFYLYGVMGLLGFIIVDGFWLWHLYTNYGNPLFPFYNNLFKSPLIAPSSFTDRRFLPKSWIEYFCWPIVTGLNSLRMNEIKFSDFRFAFLYIFLILYFISIVLKKALMLCDGTGSKNDQNPRFDLRTGNYLLAFLISSYIIWMIQFSIYRYIIPLELLVPLCILLILDRLFKKQELVIVVLVITLIIGGKGYQSFNWGRTDWSTPYIAVDTSLFKPGDEGIVMMLGWEPTAYVIPFFPESFRFVRPESNFIHQYQYGFYEHTKNLIDETTNPVFVLYRNHDPTLDLDKSLQHFGLLLDERDCSALSGNIPDEIQICRAAKIDQTLP